MPYCSRCGKELQEEDKFCSSCGTPMGDVDLGLQTQEIEVPYPDSDSARLEITVRSAGRVNISGVSKDKFVEGTIEFDNLELKPKISTTGDRVRISQNERFVDRFRSHPVNRWNLLLGDAKPFSMDVRCGVSIGRLELGGLPITDLRMEAGVSNNMVTFEKPNPQELGLFRLSAGAGDLDVRGLLNSNFRRLKVDGGVGEVKLGFTGQKPSHDCRVEIGGGVGSFNISVAETIPARARIEGLASVSALGGFVRTQRGGFRMGGVYTNNAYETSDKPRLELEIRMGVGSVHLDTI